MNQPVIICDLDGTIALLGDRNPFTPSLDDTVNQPVARIISVFAKYEHVPTIFVSGREEKYRPITEQWLSLHHIPYSELYLRRNKDFRKDFVVKRELYDAHIRPRFDVLFVLDDRDQSVAFWRELGLPCFQVAEGNF